jgi:hypothetical protein
MLRRSAVSCLTSSFRFLRNADQLIHFPAHRRESLKPRPGDDQDGARVSMDCVWIGTKKAMLNEPVSPGNQGWWGRKDSNLRSHEAADLQSAPFATRDTPPSNSVRHHRPGWRRKGSWMTLITAGPGHRCAAGAFMGEATWQSQPMEAANQHPFAVQIAIIRNP